MRKYIGRIYDVNNTFDYRPLYTIHDSGDGDQGFSGRVKFRKFSGAEGFIPFVQRLDTFKEIEFTKDMYKVANTNKAIVIDGASYNVMNESVEFKDELMIVTLTLLNSNTPLMKDSIFNISLEELQSIEEDIRKEMQMIAETAEEIVEKRYEFKDLLYSKPSIRDLEKSLTNQGKRNWDFCTVKSLAVILVVFFAGFILGSYM